MCHICYVSVCCVRFEGKVSWKWNLCEKNFPYYRGGCILIVSVIVSCIDSLHRSEMQRQRNAVRDLWYDAKCLFDSLMWCDICLLRNKTYISCMLSTIIDGLSCLHSLYLIMFIKPYISMIQGSYVIKVLFVREEISSIQHCML